MDIEAEYLVPHPPHISKSGLDSTETALLKSLNYNLRSVHSECENILSAIALFQVCRLNEEQTLPGWRRMAGRDGAMSLHNFYEALEGLRSQAGQSVATRDVVDLGILKMVSKEFLESFPKVHKLRHSVAHPELYGKSLKNMSSKSRIEIHGSTLAAGTTLISGFFNSTYISTFDGVSVEWNLTAETAAEISRLARDVVSAFKHFEC